MSDSLDPLVEHVAHAVRKWLGRLDVTTFNIEPGSPWENSYIERFNARLRDKAEPVP